MNMETIALQAFQQEKKRRNSPFTPNKRQLRFTRVPSRAVVDDRHEGQARQELRGDASKPVHDGEPAHADHERHGVPLEADHVRRPAKRVVGPRSQPARLDRRRQDCLVTGGHRVKFCKRIRFRTGSIHLCQLLNLIHFKLYISNVH